MLLDLTMMFAYGRLSAKLSRSCRADWQCLRRMTGLGEALRSSAGPSRMTVQPACAAVGLDSAFLQLSLLGDACGEEEPRQRNCRHASSGLVSMLA